MKKLFLVVSLFTCCAVQETDAMSGKWRKAYTFFKQNQKGNFGKKFDVDKRDSRALNACAGLLGAGFIAANSTFSYQAEKEVGSDRYNDLTGYFVIGSVWLTFFGGVSTLCYRNEYPKIKCMPILVLSYAVAQAGIAGVGYYNGKKELKRRGQ